MRILFCCLWLTTLIPLNMVNGLNLEEVVEEAVENNSEIIAAREKWKCNNGWEWDK